MARRIETSPTLVLSRPISVYCCAYGFGYGNIVLPGDIEKCLTDKVATFNPSCSVALGCDPGFGSSATGIWVLMLEDNKLKVLYAKEFHEASYEQMVNLCLQLKYQFKPQRLYVDGSRPDFCRSLKTQVGESTEYEKVMELAATQKVRYSDRMFVVPINFNEDGRDLLGRLQNVISKGLVSIPLECRELVTQLRTARYKPNGNLEKDDTGGITYDVFDAFRLSLKMFPLKGKMI